MANILAAIGEAAPALTQTWRNLQATDREERQTKMAETMMPFQIEQARSNVALTQANVSRIQQENEQKATLQKKLNEPDTVDRWVQKMPLSPEGKNAFRMLMPGLDPSGVGTRGEIAKATTEALANPLFKNIITSEHEFTQQRYQTAKENYETLNVKPGAQEKATEAYKIMMAEKKNLDVTGRLAGTSIETDRNRKLIKDWREKNPDTYNTMSQDEKKLINMAEHWGTDLKTLQGELAKIYVKEINTTGLSNIEKLQLAKQKLVAAGVPEDDRRMKEVQGAIDKVSAPSGKVPSSGNAVDTALRIKFGTNVLTDPKLAAEGDKWLGTKEGKTEVEKWAQSLTPPGITLAQTSEGFVPVQTKGAGIGTVGEPTGLGKPVPSGLQNELSFIEQIRDTYKALEGVVKETGWHGPVGGAYGETVGRVLPTGEGYEDKRVMIAKLKDIVYPKSGKQLNETELATLTKYVPSMTDKDETYKSKMKDFIRHLDSIEAAKRKEMKEGGMGKLREKEVSFSPKKFDELVKYAEESLGKAKTDAQKNEIKKRFRDMTGKELPIKEKNLPAP